MLQIIFHSIKGVLLSGNSFLYSFLSFFLSFFFRSFFFLGPQPCCIWKFLHLGVKSELQAQQLRIPALSATYTRSLAH